MFFGTDKFKHKKTVVVCCHFEAISSTWSFQMTTTAFNHRILALSKVASSLMTSSLDCRREPASWRLQMRCATSQMLQKDTESTESRKPSTPSYHLQKWKKGGFRLAASGLSDQRNTCCKMDSAAHVQSTWLRGTICQIGRGWNRLLEKRSLCRWHLRSSARRRLIRQSRWETAPFMRSVLTAPILIRQPLPAHKSSSFDWATPRLNWQGKDRAEYNCLQVA